MSTNDTHNDKTDVVLNHEYDGIKELDNPLPMWWLWTFFGTIIFAFIYWLHYEIAGAPNTDLALQQQLSLMSEQKKLEEASEPKKSPSDLNTLTSNPEVVASGNKLYQINCANCHGTQGQGGIGPNLTDKHWLHGEGTIDDVLSVVKKGVLDKGMPAWEAIFKSEELEALSAYVMSLQGTNPPNAKAPQGEEES